MAQGASENRGEGLMSFGAHFEQLRLVLLRCLAATALATVIVFFFKEATFRMLLAPGNSEFVTYRALEMLARSLGIADFSFAPFSVQLIATDVSSQFMAHLSMAVTLGLLIASPYIAMEILRYILPALYSRERKFASALTVAVYAMFALGIAMCYYVMFPISFRFLATYSVSESVLTAITIDSYVSMFTGLTFTLGIVFQLPVVIYLLSRHGIVNAALLAKYRRHAVVALLLVSAIITPPDLMTLFLVSLPLWGLYELGILVARLTTNRKERRALSAEVAKTVVHPR